ALDVGGEDAVVHALDHRRQQPLALAQRPLHDLERLDQLARLALGDREAVLDDVPGGGGAERRGEHPLQANAQVEKIGQRQLAGGLAVEELAQDPVGLVGGQVEVDEALALRDRQQRGGPAGLADRAPTKAPAWLLSSASWVVRTETRR